MNLISAFSRNLFAFSLFVILNWHGGPNSFIHAQVFIPQVKITEGGSPALRNAASENLGKLLYSMKLYSNRIDTSLDVSDICVNDGYAQLKSLAAKYKLDPFNSLYQAVLIRLPKAGFYLVRDIDVRSLIEIDPQKREKMLIFSLDQEGKIAGVKFGIPGHRYRYLLERNVLNQEKKQLIEQFVDNIKSAYNEAIKKEGARALKEFFGDSALIIVGHELKSEGSVSFKERTLPEYVGRLNQILRENQFTNVDFDLIEIFEHSREDNRFAIRMRQTWNSDAAKNLYSDSGYLLLAIKIHTHNSIEITARVWQKEKIMKHLTPFDEFNLIQ